MGNYYSNSVYAMTDTDSDSVQIDLNDSVVEHPQQHSIQPHSESTESKFWSIPPIPTHPYSLYFGSTQLHSKSLTNPTPEKDKTNHKIKTLVSPVNINRVSLKLVERDEEVGTYHVEFIFDSVVSCTVKVYYYCSLSELETKVPCYHYGEGITQVFRTTDNNFLDTSDRTDIDFAYNEQESRYPIIIIIQANEGQEIENNKDSITQQMICATIAKSVSGDSHDILSIEQTVLYDGLSYTIHDIFGLDHNSAVPPDECVICMTEMKDTVVLPCRHLCICHQCAQVLHYQSNKCPICRGSVRSMLKIKITKDEEKLKESLLS